MSLMYVPRDILSDTLVRSHLHSDARMLAEEFGGATQFWGGLWLLIAGVVTLYTLRWTLLHSHARAAAKPTQQA
jgi:hypothetical protein